jgi:hypothetical protein
MFEPVLARERRRASSAAAELTKDLWRKKTDLSEKNGRFIYYGKKSQHASKARS